MLAMETLNGGDLAGAVTVFEELITADPNYPPAYFHGGQTLEKLGRTEEARAIYRKGIDVTTATGDDHTRGELQGALDMIS
jgi:Flp pilus assembly protein TadD